MHAFLGVVRGVMAEEVKVDADMVLGDVRQPRRRAKL
jgi:hypothetical protein